jgi:hypothetical protein
MDDSEVLAKSLNLIRGKVGTFPRLFPFHLLYRTTPQAGREGAMNNIYTNISVHI